MDLHAKRQLDKKLLLRMRDTMVSRGPDEAGYFLEDGVGFSHRRLSIIDVSSGQQPMTSEDGSVTITYNGEVYNYQSIRKELSELGCIFRTDSDTEVILHAWSQWGERCVDRFRGMFAFAIWDERSESLFLARDRLGIKPLFYGTTTDGLFVFGSELKAITCVPEINLALELSSVEDYFTFGYIPDPKSIYAGIHKLEPGCAIRIVRGREPVVSRYWDVIPATDCPGADLDVQDQLISRLTEAVDIRLMAEVPLGAFLSGGVDSSTIVALMAGLSQRPVNTCSIGFVNAMFDESSHADLVAQRYSTAHHTMQIDDEDHSLVASIAGVYGEPFADSSAIPTLRVCELAKKHVTVALSGDGADETLAGYRRQRFHMNEERVRQMLPLGFRSRFFGTLGNRYPKADWAPKFFRAKTTLQALGRDSVSAYHDTVSQNSAAVRERLYSADFKRQLNGYNSVEVFRKHAARTPSEDPLTLIQYLDIKTYLCGDILTKVDRASMAHSLEVRVPFLDHHLVDWCLGLAPRHRLSEGIGKRALKLAMEDKLPRDILHRPKKGFSVPLADWTRGPLEQQVKDSLGGERLRDSGLFDVSRLDSIVSEHMSGLGDHSTLIWSLMMFDAHLATGHTEMS